MKLHNIEYNINWARVVSDLLSPPVVWGVMVFPVALRDTTSREHVFLWAALYIFMVCLLPVIYIAVMVKRGAITDLHMQVRGQRIRPLMVTIICTGLTWAIMSLMGAPKILPLFVLFVLVQLALMVTITLVWQISIHAISISGAAVATGALFGPLGALLTAPLVVLVGAARLKLRRHTPAQVVAGSVIGAILPFAWFFLAFVE